MDTKPAPTHAEHASGGDGSSIRKVSSTSSPPAHEEVDERAVALRLARTADPGLRLASWRGLKFIFYVLVVCMCSGDSGFDGTIMSSVNSMLQFQRYFNLGTDGKGAAKTGIVFGIYTVGQVCAFFPAVVLPDRIGRRWTMFLANLLLVGGAFLAGFAQNMSMFLGGRFLVGMGCTCAAQGAKSYLSEVTSPWNRGRWMGLQNSFYYVGQLLASGLAIPLGRIASNWSWRVPLLLQCMLGFINVLFVLLLPESPRWVYAQGRRDEAVKILADLHSRDNDINSPLVQLEIAEFEESISLTGADKRPFDFRPLFTTAAQRYRFGMCVIVACWGQLSGNGLITYFLPLLLKQAGIQSPDRQRVLNFVNSVTSFIGALTGTSLVDFVGRRFLMLFAEISCMSGMFIVAGLLSNSGPQNQTRANAGISFIFLFMVFYSFGWTPLQSLYPAESLAYEVRAKGLALQSWCTNIFSLINTFGLPSALAALSWKTYLIFGIWDIVGIIVIYLFVVETKQLSLEELDEVFNAPNPKQTSFALAAEAKKREAEHLARLNAGDV
ncbi:Lactose permease [Vanrija pseudolonga]|uniref:Lactose permease n=1 Tax=Vanrija pseudolonga TaxID=143232 RepID=A0AAF1BGL7_9TREE|nr:Lactose permease [Vanrija pseudolonga]